jgi:hypothetical protein
VEWQVLVGIVGFVEFEWSVWVGLELKEPEFEEFEEFELEGFDFGWELEEMSSFERD